MAPKRKLTPTEWVTMDVNGLAVEWKLTATGMVHFRWEGSAKQTLTLTKDEEAQDAPRCVRARVTPAAVVAANASQAAREPAVGEPAAQFSSDAQRPAAQVSSDAQHPAARASWDVPTQDVGVSIAAAAAVATSERPRPRWYREDTKPLWAGCQECKRLKFCGSFGGSSPPYWRLWRRHGLQSYELFVELPRCELRYASSYSVSATQFTARWKYEEPVSHTFRDYTLHFHWPATVDLHAPAIDDSSLAFHWFSSC